MTQEETEMARFELHQRGPEYRRIAVLIIMYGVLLAAIALILWRTFFSWETARRLAWPLSIIIYCKIMMNNRGSIKIGWNNVAFINSPYRKKSFRTVTRRFSFKLPWEEVRVIDLSFKHQVKNDPKKMFRAKDQRWVTLEAILIMTPDWRRLAQYSKYKDDTIDEIGQAVLDQFLTAYCAEHDSTKIMPTLQELENNSESKRDYQKAFEKQKLNEFKEKYGVDINAFEIKTVEPSKDDKEIDANMVQAKKIIQVAKIYREESKAQEPNNPISWAEALRQSKEGDSKREVIRFEGLGGLTSFNFVAGGATGNSDKKKKNKKEDEK